MPFVRTLRSVIAAATLSVSVSALPAQAVDGSPREVRQIVTFLFQPQRTADAVAIYEQQLKPIYADVAPLLRFRAYREAESPEPLDLVVVSSYRGMAGMDLANEALRLPPRAGRSASALYGTLAAMTQTHHDQFVEMLPFGGGTPDDSAGITVFEYLRVPVSQHRNFVAQMQNRVREERTLGLFRWSEFGRMLVSDGWDFLRIHQMRSLADWQRYRAYDRESLRLPGGEFEITARKTIILRQDPRLSVR